MVPLNDPTYNIVYSVDGYTLATVNSYNNGSIDIYNIQNLSNPLLTGSFQVAGTCKIALAGGEGMIFLLCDTGLIYSAYI